MPPDSCDTSSMPRARMYADAFSHRMPPVQYMSTFLSLSSSTWRSTNAANSEYVLVLGSSATPRPSGASKRPSWYSLRLRTSITTSGLRCSDAAAAAASRSPQYSSSTAWNCSGVRCAPPRRRCSSSSNGMVPPDEQISAWLRMNRSPNTGAAARCASYFTSMSSPPNTACARSASTNARTPAATAAPSPSVSSRAAARLPLMPSVATMTRPHRPWRAHTSRSHATSASGSATATNL
mmetsp:Transcript_57061/g.140358  ORF Transcript_57061/g.140358 Transcript_57061/m.140358 type:complete len:237 (+) Transcript_57061:64-774(+)